MKFIGIFYLFFFCSCATIIIPSGGPRDTDPPKVIKTYPENKTTNFSDNKIILYFNEFVELNQPLSNISVSPYTHIKPKANVVGKKVYVEFPDGLKPNTTYSIEFNNAIKDYSEGNNLGTYSIAFSTGFTLDSGILIVKVQDAKSLSHSDMTKVCLVKKKSDFFGKNYQYLTTANAGKAQFSNLTKEPFQIYAFVDSNMNMSWDKTEAIAFSRDQVKAGQPEINLMLFHQKLLKNNFIVTPKNMNEFDIYLNQDISFPEIIDTNFILIPQSSQHFKIITKSGFQPQKLRLKYDGDKYETLELPATKPSKYLEKIKTTDDRMSPIFRNDTLRIAFNGFLTKFDSSKILIKLDGKLVRASFGIQRNYLMLTRLDFGKNYQLSIDSQALWSYNLYNTSFVQELATFPKEKFYENITMTLDPSLAANKNLKIFQVKDNQWYPLVKQAKTILKNQYGDEIKFYILIDDNNDGMWTTGDIEKEIQPEKLYLETIKLEPKKKDYILKITNP